MSNLPPHLRPLSSTPWVCLGEGKRRAGGGRLITSESRFQGPEAQCLEETTKDLARRTAEAKPTPIPCESQPKKRRNTTLESAFGWCFVSFSLVERLAWFLVSLASLGSVFVGGFALWAVFFGIKPLAEGSKEHEPADASRLARGRPRT